MNLKCNQTDNPANYKLFLCVIEYELSVPKEADCQRAQKLILRIRKK